MSKLFPCSRHTSLGGELKGLLPPIAAQPPRSQTRSHLCPWYVPVNSSVPPEFSGPVLSWRPSLFAATHVTRTVFFLIVLSSRFNKDNSIFYFKKISRLQWEGTTSNFQHNIKIKQALKPSSTYIPGNASLIFSSNAILLFIYDFI